MSDLSVRLIGIALAFTGILLAALTAELSAGYVVLAFIVCGIGSWIAGMGTG